MLQELYIKNFALIEEIRIEFQEGFNILTGETGAGKSILIDAVGLLLGNRASSEYVRTGCKKAIIQGAFIFDVQNILIYNKHLDELGIDKDENNIIILTREISESGKNICRINNQMVTLTNFQSLSRLLVEIHGQNATQHLTDINKQGIVLDRLDSGLSELKLEINQKYKELNYIGNELNRLRDSIKEGHHEKSFLEFQIEEISDAELKPGEEEQLERELKILSSAGELLSACQDANDHLLSSKDGSKSAYDLIGIVLDRFKGLRNINSELDINLNELEKMMNQIQDLVLNLKSFSLSFDFDQYRMQYIEERLNSINRIKRKYGNDIDDILTLKEKLKDKLFNMENAEEILADLEKKFSFTAKEYDTLAEKIHLIRKKTANMLENKILKILKDLAMPNVKFSAFIEKLEERGPFGRDRVEFLISPNPGEPLKSLAKIASGGELARIMLSLKNILAEIDNVPVLIFDEIDAGIGGLALKPVAEKLAETSKFCQIICVTHSPQIAAYADVHFYIHKIVEKDKTHTKILKLTSKDEKVEELSRMLGATAMAKEHALELAKIKK